MTILAAPPAKPTPASLICALADLFPVFVTDRWREHRPLKVGIGEELIATGIMKGWEVAKALRHYCGGRMYLRAVAAGGFRYDLSGMPAGEISTEDREWARTRLAEIDARQAREAASMRASKEAGRQAAIHQKETEKAEEGRAWIEARRAARTSTEERKAAPSPSTPLVKKRPYGFPVRRYVNSAGPISPQRQQHDVQPPQKSSMGRRLVVEKARSAFDTSRRLM
jgi:sRNA-binding protein